MVYKGLYEAEVYAEQEARNRRAKRLLATIDQQMQSSRVQPFCLYLRPFQTTAHLDAQQRGSVEALDLETVLERSLGTRLPLLALARNSENAVLGSSRVYVPDEVWWTYFTRLADLATRIFVLPSDQGSTPDEISWLLSNGHLGKCIFIMPETNTGEGWHAEVQIPSTVHVSEGENIDYRPYWESVRVGLSQKLGFDLPPYDNKGAFFRLDESGAVTAFQHLGLGRSTLKARRVRKVLASLTPRRVVLLRQKSASGNAGAQVGGGSG